MDKSHSDWFVINGQCLSISLFEIATPSIHLYEAHDTSIILQESL